MRPQSPDTDLETERLWFERLSRLPSERKFEMISAASRAAGELALAGIRGGVRDLLDRALADAGR